MNSLKIDISISDKASVVTGVNKLLDIILIKFKKEFILVLKEDFVDDYMTVFETEYEYEFISSVDEPMNPSDLTSPEHIKDAVFSYVREHLHQSLNKVSESGDSLEIRAIPSSLFPKPSRKDTDKIKLFYFYLYGTPGEYVVLGEKEYKKMFPQLKNENLRIGRYGTVHMLTMRTYEDMYYGPDNKMYKQKYWPDPEDIVHPFSGSPPSNIFERVFSYILINFNGYIQKAISRGTKS